MKAYFVSDIHIAGWQDSKVQLFGQLLDRLLEDKQLTHFFMVGDIFDLWIADQGYFIKTYSSLIDKIIRLKAKGVEIHYFEGNHDLYLTEYWQKQLGVYVHSQAQYFTLGKKVLRIEHGDQMDPEDKAYLFLRKFLRTSPMRFLAHHLPEFLVVKIGTYSSKTSRQYTSKTKTISEEAARAKIRSHAQNVYNLQPFDFIISGHVHVEDDWQAESFRSINLGTWLKEPVVYVLDDEGVSRQTLA